MATIDYLPPLRHDGQETSDYTSFTVTPISGALGAELHGIDLVSRLDRQQLAELRRALLNHMVLVLRDQDLDAGELVALGRAFGPLHINPFVEGVAGHPEVMEVRSEENETARFAGRWHSDITWAERPSLASLLHARIVPPFGGDTLFANMVLAWDALSPVMRRMLDRLNAEHTAFQGHDREASLARAPETVSHPLVRTHPESGRKALFVNEYFTRAIEGMTSDESRPILDFLFRHLIRPEFTCRVRWQPNTLVIWDNRCTQHYATNDYPGTRRLMWRVTVEGDRPV
ncbi:MAG: TauD/TfdA family dioxygenase [Alphaproteobacteria bacterium]|nr:TauD/TfdA family dioxygenase [Alphaproteobacteria bacterium]